MVLIGIGAVLALLPAFLALRAKARHDRVIRLIHETPVTPIAELVQSSKADPAVPILVAVQGHVVARKTTRLTAPITGRSCVAYNVHVLYKWSELGEPEENHIGDSTWVPWAVDDGTGPALAPFDPLEHRFGFVDGWQPRYRWPRTESSGDTFKNTPRQLERVISHYGRWRLPSPEGLLPDSSDRKDLSWKVRILKEFGNKVFLLVPCTVQEGCAHFHLGDVAWISKCFAAATDSLLCFGSRADALSHEQLSARRSARWAKIWFIVFVILAVVYLLFG